MSGAPVARRVAIQSSACALAVVATLAGVSPTPAPAAPKAEGDAFARCNAGSGGVEPALKACAAAEIGRRDAALNATYGRLVGAVDPARRPALRAAERAWVAFRDAECAFDMSAEAGGMDAPLVEMTCRIDLTVRRSDDLGRALKLANF